MRAKFFLVGYDRRTGEATAHHGLPAAIVEAAKPLGGTPGNDPATIGNWSVSSDAARAIAAQTGAEIDAEHLDYCPEPHAPIQAAAHVGRATP
jgi:hypothetical protein